MAEQLLQTILGSDGAGTASDSQFGKLTTNVTKLEKFFNELDAQVTQLEMNLKLLGPYIKKLLSKENTSAAVAAATAVAADETGRPEAANVADAAQAQVADLEARLQTIFNILQSVNIRLDKLPGDRKPVNTLSTINAQLKGLLPKEAAAESGVAAKKAGPGGLDIMGRVGNAWGGLMSGIGLGKKASTSKPEGTELGEISSSDAGELPVSTKPKVTFPPSPPPLSRGATLPTKLGTDDEPLLDPLGALPVPPPVFRSASAAAGGRRRRKTKRKNRKRKTRKGRKGKKGGWQTPKANKRKSLKSRRAYSRKHR
jgi:hypothetical protein